MTPEEVEVEHGRYDQIEGEAYERYLLDVIRGWAAEQERLGFVGRRLIKDVRFVGDAYPHWGIEMDTLNPQNDRALTSKFPLRGDPSLFDARQKDVVSTIIGDMLVEVREGG